MSVSSQATATENHALGDAIVVFLDVGTWCNVIGQTGLCREAKDVQQSSFFDPIPASGYSKGITPCTLDGIDRRGRTQGGDNIGQMFDIPNFHIDQ